jgi:protoheme IX farnesyltransferase
MLPVTAGLASTRRQIAIYSVIMAVAAIAPWPLGLTGAIYGAAAVALNITFVVLALRVAGNSQSDPKLMRAEKRLFAYSIAYLFALFAALVADRWLPL